MKRNPPQFLSPDPLFSTLETAAAVILPVAYEGGVSYGTGTARGPEAVIEASAYLELYDEVLEAEPHRMGIATAACPELPPEPEAMLAAVRHCADALLERDPFLVGLGGDHSVTTALFQAVREHYGRLSAVQIDAHADLRDRYEGSIHSHACVMSRIRQMTPDTLQIGIRSLSREEALRIRDEQIAVCTMHDYRSGRYDLEGALAALPDPVYLTVDVDAFDWSVIRSTGTPEPGGFLWDEGLALLRRIFRLRNVVACDVVELSYDPEDRNSPFAAAKLIYKMLGFKLASAVERGHTAWPSTPRGAILGEAASGT